MVTSNTFSFGSRRIGAGRRRQAPTASTPATTTSATPASSGSVRREAGAGGGGAAALAFGFLRLAIGSILSPLRAPAREGGMENGSDVIVVGGGLAGLTAAVELARKGRRVTIVEKSETLGGRA